MALTLRVAPDDIEADIRIHLPDTDGTTPIAGSGIPGVDGISLDGARVLVRGNPDTGPIRNAHVVFGLRLPRRHCDPPMLEELTQAQGLLTDIRNPAYEGVSVFPQDSNAARRLGPQDIMALRRHDPIEE